jgi:hypothetical protein
MLSLSKGVWGARPDGGQLAITANFEPFLTAVDKR